MSRSAHMDEVVEAARSNRNLNSVLCDMLAERRRGFLRSTAAALVKSLKNPFPFFAEDAMNSALTKQVSSEDWDETLQDLRLVADMLAARHRLLTGDLVRLVIEAIHRSFPALGQEAAEARELATHDVEEKGKVLVAWIDRVEVHVEELAAREGLQSTIQEAVTIDELRRELGV
ncbi:MAG: hypothetical protein H5U40_11280 [Polyangiaceae bacterium]|nr:hypothetical protein [Polyangiaceae bacterium]